MDELDKGFWCDVCHQKHYQMNPACFEERRRREIRQSPEYQREIKRLLHEKMAEFWAKTPIPRREVI